jgi:hypothetical protein
VKVERWREECKKRRLSAADEESASTFRQHWRRATEELDTLKKIGLYGDWVWLTNQQRKPEGGHSHG